MTDQGVRCECGSPDCDEVLPLSHARKEQLKRDPRVRIVAPGHIADSGTVVLIERPSYWVVRTIAPADEGFELGSLRGLRDRQAADGGAPAAGAGDLGQAGAASAGRRAARALPA